MTAYLLGTFVLIRGPKNDLRSMLGRALVPDTTEHDRVRPETNTGTNGDVARPGTGHDQNTC